MCGEAELAKIPRMPAPLRFPLSAFRFPPSDGSTPEPASLSRREPASSATLESSLPAEEGTKEHGPESSVDLGSAWVVRSLNLTIPHPPTKDNNESHIQHASFSLRIRQLMCVLFQPARLERCPEIVRVRRQGCLVRLGNSASESFLILCTCVQCGLSYWQGLGLPYSCSMVRLTPTSPLSTPQSALHRAPNTIPARLLSRRGASPLQLQQLHLKPAHWLL